MKDESQDKAEHFWPTLVEFLFATRSWWVAICAEFDLTPAQGHALRVLDPARPVPMSMLAEALVCDASNVTGIVDKLESRGLIARQGTDHDRRVKHAGGHRTGMRDSRQAGRRHHAPALRRRGPSGRCEDASHRPSARAADRRPRSLAAPARSAGVRLFLRCALVALRRRRGVRLVFFRWPRSRAERGGRASQIVNNIDAWAAPGPLTGVFGHSDTIRRRTPSLRGGGISERGHHSVSDNSDLRDRREDNSKRRPAWAEGRCDLGRAGCGPDRQRARARCRRGRPGPGPGADRRPGRRRRAAR